MVGALTIVGGSPRAAPGGVYEAMPLETRQQQELLDQARRLGEEFQRLGLVVKDATYARWIEQVGARLSPAATDPYIRYRFFLLRDPTPNAFALADGSIYVHTGTLAWLQNEAQLEALLAHELAHTAGHHTLVSSRVAKRREISGSVVTGLLWPVSGLYTNAVDVARSTVTRLSLSSYSRDLEREADTWGVQLLQRQGRDGTAMVALFEQMARSSSRQSNRSPSLGRRHPSFAERVATLQDLAGPASADAARADPQFTAFVAPLAVQAVQHYVLTNKFQTAVELSASLVERLPDDPAVRVAAGDAWRALGPLEGSSNRALTPKERRRLQQDRRRRTRGERYELALRSSDGQINLARHLAEAESQYRRALALDPSHAAAWRGLGEVLASRSQDRAAAAAFVRYLRLRPRSPDAAAILARARGLAGKANGVVRRPPRQVVVLPPSVSVLERRVGTDLAQPAVAMEYERRAARQAASGLRAAGYEVRLVSRESLEVDPVLRELTFAAEQRFNTMRGVLKGRPGRRAANPHVFGDAAVGLAGALGADALVFQEVDLTVAGWGQLARAMTLSSLTFLFRDVAGAGRSDIYLVDGHSGALLTRHRAVSRVIARRALTRPDVPATLVEGALRNLPPSQSLLVEAVRNGEPSAGELDRLDALLGVPGLTLQPE
ncbi:MAG: M48 family metalloprotease [Pseudomonadota bacterium]